MSQVFEVKSVGGEPREWTSSHGGTFLSYKVDLQSDQGLAMGVEWNKKPESRAPSVGETVAGHLEEGKYGEKFKIDYDATKEIGQQGPSEAVTTSAATGGAKGGWQPESERDPERAARILRQHSQEMALRYCALLGDRVALEQVLNYANQFDRDVDQAGRAAVQGAGAASHPAGSQGSSPATAPAPEQQPVDDAHQYFCKLLEDAALNPTAAHALGTFIIEKFDNDQRRRAETGLKHLDTQKETLDKARFAYEKATGQLLPDGDGDDIPF